MPSVYIFKSYIPYQYVTGWTRTMSQVAELSAKYNQAVADCEKTTNAMKAREKEREKLRKQEEELQSRQDGFSLKEQAYNKRLSKIRAQHQIEISEIKGHLTKQYEVKLQQSLQELKHQHEIQMRASKNQIAQLSENKVCKFVLRHIFGSVVVNMKLGEIFRHK
jgi:lamin B